MEKVSKARAQKAFTAGQDVTLVPSKCGVGSMFDAKVNNQENSSLDNFINHFHYYNCNTETGLGIHFYLNA